MSKSAASPAAEAASRALRWRFGPVVVDGSTLETTVAGQLVKLEPKPLELLLFLLRHPGEVVTKEELHENLWPGRFLSESVLTKTMAKLRQGLRDEEQALIKTVHGYGYRLVASVVVEPSGGGETAAVNRLVAGEAIPHRPHWQLKTALGAGGHGEVWLGENAKTGEQRVFKFSHDAAGLSALKRELTLFRVMQQASQGGRRDLVKLIDFNFEEPPYFIESEQVEGGALPAWVESEGGFVALPLERRLLLMTQTAESLAAAHSAGVLHKDLKPSNILVARAADGEPYVKLGDFGSGRMLDLAQLEQLEITRLGFTQRVAPGDDSTSGTPLYFAPELLAGQQPTVQSDVYSLGIVLYQMLVGDFKRPLAPGWELDIEDELLREDIALAAAGKPALRLGDATQLATRLATLPARRAAQCERLQLEAARQRAEAEAERLRTALQRARLRRRWQRGLAAVLALGLGLSSFGFWQARRAQQAAEQAAAETRLVNRFLADDVLAAADPLRSGSRDVSALALLDAAKLKLPTRFADSPAARIEIDLALAAAYRAMGQLPAALELAEHAQRTAVQLHGAHDPVSQMAAVRRADVLQALGRYGEAEEAYAAVLADQPASGSGLSFAARQGRAWNLYYLARHAESAALYESLLHDLPREKITERENATWGLAEVYGRLSRQAEAETLLRALIADIEQRQGARHPRAAEMRNNLVSVLLDTDRIDEAEKEAQLALDVERETLGPEHPMTLVSAHWMGVIRQAQHRHAEAIAYFEPVLAARLRLYGREHRRTGYTQRRLAQSYLETGRLREAEQLSRQSYEAALKSGGLVHPDTLASLLTLADALARQSRPAEAETLLRAGLGALSAAPEHRQQAAALTDALERLHTRPGKDIARASAAGT